MDKLFDPVKKVIEEAMVSYIHVYTMDTFVWSLYLVQNFVVMQMLPLDLLDMSLDMQS